ncbi:MULTISPECIES: DUF4145 domain-containing protein [unclassified Pseudomonas]|uniref:DUF4145 domain-containing protein n=1 Tax=unclassified Pseudomonas TaxID=196821 RepID=UPI0015A24F38|nr:MULTISPECIES: DUF4145 domain-containing protein [unclassified Pseudomonas]NWC94679.1 hypothetical protein [Pseudomonas sp. IPO3779]NWD15696.1 hypothetical protein [Pseudomonas sp. IPO3778]
MDWLQFLSSVIGSIAWPAAVITLTCLMREPLAKLIPLIRTLKYKDVQIDLGEKIEAAKELVGAEAEAPSQADKDLLSSFRSIAEVDPRAAVLSAWLPVEAELSQVADKRNVPSRMPPMAKLRELHQERFIDLATYQKLVRLRDIRNTAAHLPEKAVSFDDAMNMAEMCQWAVGLLKQLNASLDTKLT